MIPLVNTKAPRPAARGEQSWWHGPARWIVAVLAFAAALDGAYLTWTSLSHSVVAGCDGTGLVNCDLVLSSPWSRWLFVPVALGGAVCYAIVSALSIVAGYPSASRWAGTLLVMFSLLAAASGLWFIGVQIFAIGAYCLHCMITHSCGLLIAGIVLWMALRRPQAAPEMATAQSQTGVRTIPAGGPRRVSSWTSLRPSFGAAFAGATTLFLIFIGGQIFFPPQTFSASKPELDQSIDMTVADGSRDASPDDISPTAQTHVVNRPADAVPDSSPDVEEEDGQGNSNATAGDETTSVPDADAETEESETTDEEPKPEAREAPALAREVKFLNGRMKINMYTEAVLGSPEAPFVVVELMDYTCPHCREMHKDIKKARQRYGDQLAVVIMPVPLEMECNKNVNATDPMHRGACRMSRQSLAVAKLDPEAFVDFHYWLLADEKTPPSGVATLNRAWKLVDQGELSVASNSPEIKKRIQQYIKLYTALSKNYPQHGKPFGLPVQILGDTVLTGKFETTEELYEAWEKALGIKPERSPSS